MNKHGDEHIHALTSHLFREHYGKMVSFLSRKYGYQEIENIADAVQEAFEAALNTWKFSGIPDHHFAWLYKVAANRLVNKLRQSDIIQSHLGRLKTTEDTLEVYQEQELEDSLLKLLVFFSKINLPERNKLIVSLYFVCGFGYTEIANALMMNTETVKKVVLRSKERIGQFARSYQDFQISTIDDQTDHLLRIIYLMFNEGYKASRKKETICYDLCYEAMRLAKLVQKYNDHPGANALLALMFFSASRFPARIVNSTWVSLEDQDRSLWNKALITEGYFYLERARTKQVNPDAYYLQALISSIHSTSASYEETDWKAISFLYRQLEKIGVDSVPVTLNRIISESNYRNIDDLITESELLERSITKKNAFIFYSTRAYLYLRMKNTERALDYYKRALEHTQNKTDMNYICEKIALIEKMNA